MPDDVMHFINGRATSGLSQQRQPLYDPLTNQLSKQVCFANYDDVNTAVASANNAFVAWSQTPVNKRAKVIFNFKKLLDENIDELATIVMSEHGKTFTDAQASVKRGLAVVDYACGIGNLLKGEISVNVSKDIDIHSVRQPLGVCVGITPFNFPVMIPLWMFPLAIACGNTFVLKPSERDPSVTVKLAKLMQQAGLPDGVLNVIHGDNTAVDALITHSDVKAVSFVGSTPVARHVYHTAHQHHKRVQAFAGAKNHCIVMPDCNMEHAANAIFGAAYGSAGERCMALSVAVTVGDKAGDKLISQLKKLVPTLKLGAGDDTSVDMGPLITREHLNRVLSYVENGVEAGAKLIVDGRDIKAEKHPDGNFMGGCLFDHVTSEMNIYQDEIFGPVLCVVRAADFAQAIKLINDNPYGNGTAIFTRDAAIAREFANKVQVGMVGVNVPIPVPDASFSFGGWKNSVFADVHMHGPEGIQFYTKLKTVTSTWPISAAKKAEFHLPTGE